ncbi:hypothetical protein [Georgenia sp. MJ170]|uniref:hypothetical protein n=1 Tax=Georgenia sunbinii TaxID=3117728 RepID=UPI002F267F61
MPAALTWLRPSPVSPLAVHATDGPWFAGARFDGLLQPTTDGGLAAADLLASPDGRATALSGSMPPGTVVARLSAVWIHTGRHRPERLALLVAPTEPRGHHHGSIHRQRYDPADVTHIGTVPVTTPLRTAVDLLCFDSAPRAGPAVGALIRGGLDPAAILAQLADPRRRLPVARARRRLAAVRV